ncbi:MAG: HAMP domain-containing protein [Candidatus Riflebacteria bacterium]|nr:HAMP domain-containing protein [Candidatus Riflebacteria bacterium]
MSNQKTEQKEDIITDSQQLTKRFATFYGSKLFVKCFGWFILITLINSVFVFVYSYYFYIKPAREEFRNIATKILQNNGQLMVETYEKQGNLDSTRFRGPGNLWLYNENIEILFDGNRKNNTDNRLFEPEIDRNGFYPFKDNLYPKDGNVPPKPEKLPRPRLEDKYSKIPSKPNTIEVKPPQNHLYRKYFNTFYRENIDKVNTFAKSLLNKEGTNVFFIDKEIFFGCQLLSDNGKKYIAIIHIPRDVPVQNKYWFIYRAKNVLPLLLIVCAVLCFIMARYLAKPIIELQEASRKFAKGDFSHKITKKSMDRYDEIGDLASDFNNMAERLEAGINSQKRLFNDISHELRSPLARMQVGIELLQMKVRDSEKPLVERLEKDVNRMNALISELLQFSKLEIKQIESSDEDVELEKALEAVCADAEFEGNSDHKGVNLEIKNNVTIKGNSALIERAFENVIRNALRYTPEKSVVDVSLEKIENKAVVKIADRGPGVPEDEIDKIFTPFYCINPDRNPQKGGIGLGLSIALRAIKLHKGNIKMSNRPEGGLLATIDFPLDSD